MNMSQFKFLSRFHFLASVFVTIFAVCICSVANAADPLSSWNEGAAKQAILKLVAAVTDENGKGYSLTGHHL